MRRVSGVKGAQVTRLQGNTGMKRVKSGCQVRRL